MCNNELLPYPLSAIKATASAGMAAHPPGSHPPLEQYRLHQLYNYAMQQRFAGPFVAPLPYPAYGPRLALSMSLLQQRMLAPEEPKPQHSYIGLIAMAILSSPDAKLVLSDIYQYILDNYPYFRSRGPGWRNSIRHNLSLNDCFIKAGRSANGKGHYWAIHPANVDDFKKGDFRRRKAQRKVRKHMGLAVDEEGGDSPSPPPVPVTPPPQTLAPLPPSLWPPLPPPSAAVAAASSVPLSPGHTRLFAPVPCMARKRQFDVASLLAPDDAEAALKAARLSSPNDDTPDEDIDVVTSDTDTPSTPAPAAHLLLEQHLVSRYYEHLQHSAVRRLALQQHNQHQLQLQLQQQQLHQHLQQLQQQHLQQQQQNRSTPSPTMSCEGPKTEPADL